MIAGASSDLIIALRNDDSAVRGKMNPRSHGTEDHVSESDPRAKVGKQSNGRTGAGEGYSIDVHSGCS